MSIIKAFIDNETIWLTQKQIAELFDTSRENITIHLLFIRKFTR